MPTILRSHMARASVHRFLLAMVALGFGGLPLRATIVGFNQIVTPEIQPTGVMALSAQFQHSWIGNSQQVQFELGVTPRFEVGWFQGVKPGEGLGAAELNLWHEGPSLVTTGFINWSTRGGDAQPMLEYGFYQDSNACVAGVIYANRSTESLFGYRRQLNDKLSVSFDFQAGPANSLTAGVTYNLTPTLCINPAIYRTNSRRHHLLGYVVVTWNLTIWK